MMISRDKASTWREAQIPRIDSNRVRIKLTIVKNYLILKVFYSSMQSWI